MKFGDVPMGGLFMADGVLYRREYTTEKRIWTKTESGRNRRERTFINARAVNEKGVNVKPAAYGFFWRNMDVDPAPMDIDTALETLREVAKL